MALLKYQTTLGLAHLSEIKLARARQLQKLLFAKFERKKKMSLLSSNWLVKAMTIF